MRTNKECQNCWFYCHENSKCYSGGVISEIAGVLVDGSGITVPDFGAKEVAPDGYCYRWAFDGLEDWEREALLVQEAAA